MFQRPKRALLISTVYSFYAVEVPFKKFQRPKRALLISTTVTETAPDYIIVGFNALSGLFSFLRNTKICKGNLPEMFQRPKRALLISTKNIGGE